MNDPVSPSSPSAVSPHRDRPARALARGSTTARRWATFGIATGLFVAALAARVYCLDAIPPGAWYDEALNGLNGLQVIDTIQGGAPPPIFFAREGHPQEPLYLWIVALMFRLFGASTWALRLTSAFIGALTVPVFWLALRRLRPPAVALIAAMGLIFFRWHLHFSRTGFRTILVPLMVALLIWTVATAIQTRRRRWWALAGAALGLGFYTYLSFRFAPLLLLVWAGAALWGWRRQGESECRVFIHTHWKGALLALVVAMAVFVPLGVDYLHNPFHFAGRTDAVSLFTDGWGAGAQAIAQNALGNALQFFVPGWGDHVSKHNIPYRAVFDPLSAVFFLIGLVLAARSITRPPGAWGAVCLAWLGLMLMASVFSYGAPNILRALGGAPAAIWIWAEGVNAAARRAGRQKLGAKGPQWARLALLVAPLVWLAGWQTRDYFHVFPDSPGVWSGFTTGEAELGRYVATLDPDRDVVWIGKDIIAHLTFQFESRPFTATRPLATPDAFLRSQPERDHYILVTRYNRDRLLPLLNAWIPRKERVHIFTDPYDAPWAWMYRVRAKDLLAPDRFSDAIPSIQFGA